MAEQQKAITIVVRYTQGTYVARCRGHKPTASCVYDPALAAKALARKLEFEDVSVVKTLEGQDYLEFSVNQEARNGC